MTTQADASCPVIVAPKRREAAREWTRLIEQHKEFSLIRLGDGECWYLSQVQDGKPPPKYRYLDKAGSIEVASSTSGMEARHYPRFVEALERATYLDYCDNIPKVAEYLPIIRFNRGPSLYRNSSPEVSNILFEWTWFEFKSYLQRHRCLIASAEAALLRELTADARYDEIAHDFWPKGASVWFHQIRENGRRYSENLDLIKEDLAREITKHNIDTLFLSLGTGAKVICYEIAKELGIRAIDFGSMPRALTYSGASGYQVTRSLHNPFMFRVPFAMYMSALESAHPEMELPTVISRAHAQIAQEIQDLQPFRFNTTDAITGQIDIRPERRRAFWNAVRDYERRYLPRIANDPESEELHRQFVRWRRKKGIGWDGKLFLSVVRAKGMLRKLLGKRFVPVAKA